MTFEQLPDNARLWVYQASRELSEAECAVLENEMDKFSSDWAAHGKALKNAFLIAYKRFLVISVDESQAGATGCSIDSSVAVLKKIESRFDISFFDRMQLTYKSNGEVKDASMSEFQELLREGAISERTIVFNNMVTNKGDWESLWEVPLKESWHKRFL